MAFIRPSQLTDWAAMAHICRETLPPSIASSEAAMRLSPYIWTHPFQVVCPQHCFVLDDGSGQVVGYVIGCADVHAMAAAYDRYLDVVAPALARGRGHGDIDVDPGFLSQARVDMGEPPAPSQLDHLEPWTVDGSVNETCLKQFVCSPRWLLLESAKTAAKQQLVSGPAFRATMHINLLPSMQGAGWGRRMIETFAASVAAAGALGVHIGVSGENTKVLAFYNKCGFRVEPGGEADGSVWMVRAF